MAGASDPGLAAGARYPLRRCATCGTAATELDAAEDLDALYRKGSYAPARAPARIATEPLRRLTELDRLRFLRGIPAGARVLEAGAGDGRFLSLLAARGYRVSGIEPSPPSLRENPSAGSGRALPIARSTIEDAQVTPESQDAIVAWHVIEHLAEPAGALEQLHGWLRPGGRLIVGVPNLASLQARIGGDRWFHQDVPRHRIHFTPEGMRALLERCGFAPLRTSHLVVEHNALGMWQTLLNRITGERDVAFRLLKRGRRPAQPLAHARDVATTLLAGALLALPAIILELGAGLARRGGTFVVVAEAGSAPRSFSRSRIGR